jgi:glycosyltransferase involved in cell wall biosynthesis
MGESSKIKILFLIGSFGPGGKERQLAELIKGLPSDKFEIHLFVKSESAHYLNEIKNKLDSFHSLNRKRFGIKALADIIRIIKKVKPQIVHSWAATPSFYSLLAKPFNKCKYKLLDASIQSAHAKRRLFCWESFMRIIINHFADIIVANSKAGLKAYGAPEYKSCFIYNGFDMNRISAIQSAIEIKKHWEIKTPFIVGMVARIDFAKDYPTFIKAANNILSERDDVTFVIVGDGADRKEIQAAINSDYQNGFVFTGQISNVESLINIFDIGVLATFTEGISNSIMEYMALSKPVIATRGGGTAEIVEDGETGILVSIGNKDELFQKIIYLLNNPELRHLMGLKGKNKIIQDFSFIKMIESYSSVYKTIYNKS